MKEIKAYIQPHKLAEMRLKASALLAGIAVAFAAGVLIAGAPEPRERPVDGFMDNSFLIEEAYNQEPGVVQHIVNAVYSLDRRRGSDDRAWDLVFTQEWPLFSQTHQLSFTVPYSFLETGGESHHGVSDVLLHYRLQVYFDERTLTAFAPRFSLILPTGDAGRGLGNGTLGYQGNLPFSTTLSDHVFIHANAGLTWLPDAGPSPRRDLLSYNLGASAIYAATTRLHFLMEWTGVWEDRRSESDAVEREFVSVLSPGVRVAFNFRNDSQLVLGAGVPIGLTRAAPDIGVFLYVSFEHFFSRQ